MNIHEKWPHRWLTPKAEARNSDIAGTGVFAIREINKDEPVAVLGGVIVPLDEARGYWSEMGDVGIQVDEGFFIAPTSREELETKGVFNHSCEPNIGLNTSITFVAMENIPAGDELLFDYALSESCDQNLANGMKCKCKTKSCRGVISYDDWKRKDLQEKYKGYFSPYIQKNILLGE